MPVARPAATAVVLAVTLAACPGAESPGGQEQPGPDTGLEAPAPNEGRPDIVEPDAGY